MISVSNIPGGSPVAKADSKNWTSEYGVCEKCNEIFCKKCVDSINKKTRIGKCRVCGQQIKIKGR